MKCTIYHTDANTTVLLSNSQGNFISYNGSKFVPITYEELTQQLLAARRAGKRVVHE